MLASALALLLAGLVLPAVSIRGLIFTEEYSLLDGVAAFAADGRWFLFVLVGAFTVVAPTLKILIAGWLWICAARRRRQRTLLHLLETVSRWSMLDVFVIALVVLLIDGRLLTTADVGVGAMLFTAAVALSTWAGRRLLREAAY